VEFGAGGGPILFSHSEDRAFYIFCRAEVL
jgi:hypothetical protein